MILTGNSPSGGLTQVVGEFQDELWGSAVALRQGVCSACHVITAMQWRQDDV